MLRSLKSKAISQPRSVSCSWLIIKIDTIYLVSMKIFGCFRTVDGASAFCTNRSYLVTLRKQEVDLLHALVQFFRGKPCSPPWYDRALMNSYGQEMFIDAHSQAVWPEVWTLYRRALQIIGRPIPTLIEWDTNIPPLGILLEDAQKAQHFLEVIHA